MDTEKMRNKAEWLTLYANAYEKVSKDEKRLKYVLKMNLNAHRQHRFLFKSEQMYINEIQYCQKLKSFIEKRCEKYLK